MLAESRPAEISEARGGNSVAQPPEQVDGRGEDLPGSTEAEASATDRAGQPGKSQPGETSTEGRSAKGSRRRPQAAAHAAVLDSYKDARLHSKDWQGWGFRIYPDTLAALKQRMNADRRSTSLKLAIGHYVDAALRVAPTEVTEMVKLADEYDGERVFDNDTTRPSTYRVGLVAYELASNLKVTMDEADESRRGAAFVSAAVQKLLDGLQAGGELKLPSR
ncbi:hypothetical protein [Streptomyces sp. NPDC055692]|uniref:hypothetical protein n=1 Tax=Streptomyces sp. NPDC055692 TaxID=3155683 RepID=UPI00342C4E19